MSAEMEKQGRRRRRTQEEAVEEDVEELTEDTEEDETGVATRGITPRKGRATPGRRAAASRAEAESGNAVTRPANAFVEYIRGVRDELQKVTWPTREETIRLTRIVLIVTILASAILGLVTFGYNELFAFGLRNPIAFAVFFAVAGALIYVARRWMLRSTQSDQLTLR